MNHPSASSTQTRHQQSSTIVFRDYSEEELLGWGRDRVKVLLERFARAAALAASGEPASREENTLEIPLTPFRIDYRGVFFILRDIMNLLVGEPCNLFTIITNSGADRILRAYLHEAKLNNFVSLLPITSDAAWTEPALELIQNQEFHYLHQQVNDFFRREHEFEINWVAVVDIRFFGPFRDVLEHFESNHSYRELLEGYWDASRQVFSQGWIHFTPEPHVTTRLQELFHNEMIRYHHTHLPAREIPQEIGLEHRTEPRIVVGLVGRDYKMALNLSLTRPDRLILDQDLVDGYRGNTLQGFARYLHRNTRATFCFVLRADPVFNLVFEYLSRPFPLRRLDMFILYRKLFTFLKQYGNWWDMAPRPFFLRNPVRFWGKLFGYDISRIPDQDLPALIVDGSGLIGLNVRIALVILDNDRPTAALIFETYDGAIRRISTFPSDKIEKTFQGASRDRKELRERLFRAKQIIWEEDGWVNFAFAVQQDLINAILDFLFKPGFTSIPRLIGSHKEIKNIITAARNGGILIWPNFALPRIQAWVKERGRPAIYWNLFHALFEKKGQRTRGLLYVRPTLVVLAIIILVVIAVLLL